MFRASVEDVKEEDEEVAEYAEAFVSDFKEALNSNDEASSLMKSEIE